MNMLRRVLFKLGLVRAASRDRRLETQKLVADYRARGMKIGDNVGLVNVTLDSLFPSLIEIGSDCLITHATVLAHDASPVVFRADTRVGRVRILDRVFIGAGAVVLPGVTIGPDAIVGAGTVVSRDVPEGAIVAGSPARVVGHVKDWLERKEAAGELISWEGGIIPSDAAVEAARARVRTRFG